MNKLLYFAFLSCVAIAGCDKAPDIGGDKEKPRSEHEASDRAMKSIVVIACMLLSASMCPGISYGYTHRRRSHR